MTKTHYAKCWDPSLLYSSASLSHTSILKGQNMYTLVATLLTSKPVNQH